MKLLFLGDVMGRSGRTGIIERLPKLRADWGLDFVVINGENASNGAGLTTAHAKLLLDAGADALTLGDHAFDQKDMMQFCEAEPRIIRPLNFSKAAPGKGARVFEASRGRKVLVAQVLGQVFMKRAFDDPFSAVETVLKSHPLGGMVNASLIDIHCEATSEKMAMGHYCDGRASVVVGTHTHVPTSDAMILPGGTAYQTDAGMCGDSMIARARPRAWNRSATAGACRSRGLHDTRHRAAMGRAVGLRGRLGRDAARQQDRRAGRV